MNKNFWPDLNSQIFKLTPLHPREENHPEMVNIARVFTFRSSHQHHCHSFRFSLEFSFFSLVSSTSSTCLAIMNSYMKTKTKLYSINCFIFNEKTIQLLTVSCSFRKTTMNLQPTTPATAPVEDMAAPQNQIPSSHAKYGGRFEKKKDYGFLKVAFRIAHFVGMKNCWVLFLVYSSPKITFSNGRFVLEITGS